jgi:8-oxo-dGTP pyrophosphatase MutT (NUDIX family)
MRHAITGRVLRLAHGARIGWRRITRPITLGVRALVADPAGRVLLVRHSYVGGWHLPGGGVDRAESLREAALRELREEVGIEATGDARLHGIFLRQRHGNSDHVAVFVVTAWQGVPRADGLEILETRFFSVHALPPDTTAATRARIAEWSWGIAPAELW